MNERVPIQNGIFAVILVMIFFGFAFFFQTFIISHLHHYYMSAHRIVKYTLLMNDYSFGWMFDSRGNGYVLCFEDDAVDSPLLLSLFFEFVYLHL
jgi:hypothetical protein